MATSVLYAVYHVKYFARKQKPVTDFLFRCQLLCQFCIYAAVLDTIYLSFYIDSSGLKCCCIVFDDEVCALIFFTKNFLILLLRVSMTG